MTLFVKAMSANLIRDTEWFSKMDPYCIITLGKITKQTKVHQEGGKNPVWNQLFTFQGFKSFDMKIQVKDSDPLKDDLIGDIEFSIERFTKDPKQHVEQLILNFNKKPAGKLKLSFWYKPDSNANQGESSNQGGNSYSENNFNQPGQQGGSSFNSGPSPFSPNFTDAASQLSGLGGNSFNQGGGNPFSQGFSQGGNSFNQGSNSGGFTLGPAMSQEGNSGWQSPPQNNSWGPNNNGWGGQQGQGNQQNSWGPNPNSGNSGNQGGSNSGW